MNPEKLQDIDTSLDEEVFEKDLYVDEEVLFFGDLEKALIDIEYLTPEKKFIALNLLLDNPERTDISFQLRAINIALGDERFVDYIVDHWKTNPEDLPGTLRSVSFLQTAMLYEENYSYRFMAKKARETLHEMADSDSNFLVSEVAKQAIASPCENYDIKTRRLLFKHNHMYDYGPVDGMSDEEVNWAFDQWRADDIGYFLWLEMNDIKSQYEDATFRRDYDIEPNLAEGNIRKSKIVNESTYTYLTQEHGIIYTPDGRIDSIFILDEDVEQEKEGHAKKYGTGKEDDIIGIVKYFKRALDAGDHQAFLRYFLFRDKMPPNIVLEFETQLGISMPTELKEVSWKDPDRFESDILPHKEHLMQQLESKEAMFKDLIKDLTDNVKIRQEEAGKKYLGFKSESHGNIPHYIDVINTNAPHSHHNYLYYLLLRERLPENIVEDIELGLEINIPEDLQTFDSFDDFLHTPLYQLESVFASYQIFGMRMMLTEELENLHEAIQGTLPKPQKIGIKEVLALEGFDENKMSSEEFEKILVTYQSILNLKVRKRLEDAFQIRLSDFSLREQLQFVNYLSDKSVEEVERVKKLVSKHGHEAIKAFFSLEFAQENGDAILEIGEAYDDEITQEIFKKFNEVSSLAYEQQESLNKQFFKGEEKDISGMTEIVQRAQNILTEFHHLIPEYEKLDDEAKEKKKQEILDTLETVSKDIVFFSSMFKTAYKETGSLEFSDVEGVTYSRVSGEQFGQLEDKVQTARDIYLRNYQLYPGTNESIPESFRNALLDSFEDKLTDPKSMFDVLEHNGEVIEFLNFTNLGIQNDGRMRKYFGAFNVDPRYAGSKLGEVMLRKVIDRESKDSVIEANCIAQTAIAKKYIEMGFTGTGTLEYMGVYGLNIEFDKKKNIGFETKLMPKDEIAQIQDTDMIKVRVFEKGEQVNADLPSEGFLLTRYFDYQGKTYLVFETEIEHPV